MTYPFPNGRTVEHELNHIMADECDVSHVRSILSDYHIQAGISHAKYIEMCLYFEALGGVNIYSYSYGEAYSKLKAAVVYSRTPFEEELLKLFQYLEGQAAYEGRFDDDDEDYEEDEDGHTVNDGVVVGTEWLL